MIYVFNSHYWKRFRILENGVFKLVSRTNFQANYNVFQVAECTENTALSTGNNIVNFIYHVILTVNYSYKTNDLQENIIY